MSSPAKGALVDVQAGIFIGGSFGNENWSASQAGLNVASGAIFGGVEADVRVDALTGAGPISTGFGTGAASPSGWVMVRAPCNSAVAGLADPSPAA